MRSRFTLPTATAVNAFCRPLGTGRLTTLGIGQHEGE